MADFTCFPLSAPGGGEGRVRWGLPRAQRLLKDFFLVISERSPPHPSSPPQWGGERKQVDPAKMRITARNHAALTVRPALTRTAVAYAVLDPLRWRGGRG